MKQFAILGYPLRHTLSPQIHRLLAEILGEEICYSILELPPKDWEKVRTQLLSLDGFNITIPYKIKIMDWMHRLDTTAQTHGAVNVAAREADGTYSGYNTDCLGFVRAMQAQAVPIAGRVCVLGAGGVGRMFASESARQGAQVSIAVRENHLSEAEDLAAQLQETYPKSQCKACRIEQLQGGFDLLINATPAGMFPNVDATPLGRAALEGVKVVFDCIYNPAQTRLMREAQEAGCQSFGGMKMLVWQAAAAQEIWFGRQFTNEQVQQVISQMEVAKK